MAERAGNQERGGDDMLIQCPECKQQISEQATNCPKCGRPVSDEDREAAKAAAETKRKTTTACGIGCLVLLLLVIIIAAIGGRDASDRTATGAEPATREAGVATYLEGIMAIDGIQQYINRAYQPDPAAAPSLVYVDVKRGVADWQIEKLVRSITEGVHNHSSTGVATVVAEVDGITVAEANYKVFSGSIEVKLLR